jgi:SAM-dependent methyltransferase
MLGKQHRPSFPRLEEGTITLEGQQGMRIPPPPTPSSEPQFVPGLDQIERFVEFINGLLADSGFDDRYFPRFEWFKQHLPRVRTILNVGCGHGRETFALMWALDATEAIGIDKDDDPDVPDKIYTAQSLAWQIQNFSRIFDQAIAQLARGCTKEYCEELRAWFDGRVPSEIKSGTAPLFYKMNVSARCPQHPSGFDLMYCRYVLDKIADKDEGMLRSAIRNMKSRVRPGTGRIVAVEPSVKEKDGVLVRYKFESYFEELGVEILVVKDESHLGA